MVTRGHKVEKEWEEYGKSWKRRWCRNISNTIALQEILKRKFKMFSRCYAQP